LVTGTVTVLLPSETAIAQPVAETVAPFEATTDALGPEPITLARLTIPPHPLAEAVYRTAAGAFASEIASVACSDVAVNASFRPENNVDVLVTNSGETRMVCEGTPAAETTTVAPYPGEPPPS
jgi:hypothetical protein